MTAYASNRRSPAITKTGSCFRLHGPVRSPRLLSLFGRKGPLRANSALYTFPAKITVYSSGTAANRVWLPIAGEVRLTGLGVERAGRTRIKPGDAAGLTELLAGLPYESSLITATDCAFIVIGRTAVLDAINNDPRLRSELIRNLSLRLSSHPENDYFPPM